ncbi:hypothetical protein GX865_07735 [Candidatus Saccharibacteria bacterium]|nr:hypothetical protein [Candidatus Saccharibacteria bacterium]
MRKQAVSYIARVLVQKIIGLLLYMIGARFILTYAGSIYFIYHFIATIIISLVLFKSNEETLAQNCDCNYGIYIVTIIFLLQS